VCQRQRAGWDDGGGDDEDHRDDDEDLKGDRPPVCVCTIVEKIYTIYFKIWKYYMELFLHMLFSCVFAEDWITVKSPKYPRGKEICFVLHPDNGY